MEKYKQWYINKKENNVLAYRSSSETFIEFKSYDYLNHQDRCLNLLDKYSLEHKLIGVKVLDLTLVMTHKCNLSCIYCFEMEHLRSNKPQNNLIEIDKLISNLKNLIESKSPKKIVVRFFGGEPLIEMNKIKLIMADLKSKFLDIDIIGAIFTNAYALNDNRCKELKKLGVLIVHTTLDGNEATHDLHKRDLFGRNTFRKIYENISNSIKYFNVTIRINVSKSNAMSINNLLFKLSRLKYKENIQLDIRKLNCDNTNIDSIYLSETEFIPLQLDYYKNALKLGLKCIILPHKKKYCIATNESALIIEPNGGLIRCTEEIGDLQSQYSDIENSYFNYKEYYRWINREYHKNCLDCKFLELCKGKCPKTFIRKGRFDCIYKQEYFSNLLLLKYQFAKLDRRS